MIQTGKYPFTQRHNVKDAQRGNCSHLLHQVVERGVSEIFGWDSVISVYYRKLRRVLIRMLVVTQEEQGAAEGPNISSCVDGIISPHIKHLWCSVHGRGVSGHLFFEICSLAHGPVRCWVKCPAGRLRLKF